MPMHCFYPSAQANAPLANQRCVPIGEGPDKPVCHRLKMMMEKISTFSLPSSTAPDTSSATSCATSFKCRPRADLAPQTPKRAEDVDISIYKTDFQ